MKIKELPFFKNMVLVVLFTFLLWTIPGPFSFADNLPTGYEAVSGSSSYEVSPDGTVGNLTANDNVTIGQWNQGFNVGNGFIFNAFLPAGATHLSRDITANPSEIFGSLNVPQGKFFLVNPNGIFFAPGSQVNVGGLIASTLDIANEDFLNGNYHFVQGLNPSSLISAGVMNVGASGLALLGGSVQNSGVIEAQESSVVLASGKEMTLSFENDGLISVLVDQAISAPVVDAQGDTSADAVSNTGIIRNDGGKVYLTAEATDNIFNNLVNQEGIIEANSTVNNNGVIELVSNNSNGVVTNSGVINAKGNDGLTGGTVKISGEKTGLFGGTIDVSGDTGGGMVLVGGDFQGAGSLRNADFTFMNQDASIHADALLSGDGGRVILWSDLATQFYGNISTKGGSESGNGGFSEISSGNYLGFHGYVDSSAANGSYGLLFLDPATVTLTGGTNDGDDPGGSNTSFGTNGGGNDETVLYASAVPTIIYESELEGSNANLLIQATNGIGVSGVFTGGVGLGGNGITLQTRNQAGDGSAGIDLVTGATNFSITSGGNILIQSGTSGTDAGSAPITLSALTTTGQGSITVNAEGNLTVGGALTTGNSTAAGSTGAITLTSSQGAVAVNNNVRTGDSSVTDGGGPQTAASGNISISASSSVTGSGQIRTGNASLSGSANGNDTATSGNISITAGSGGLSGGIGLSNASALVIGTVLGSTGSNTDTTNAGNITLSARDEINNGTASTPLSLTFGTASGADNANNQGSLTITTTGATGNIFITSPALLRLGPVATAVASAQTVNIATTAAANLIVLNGAQTLTGDNVILDASGLLGIPDTDFNVGNGSLTLSGNEIDLTGGANSIKGTGALVLQPNTAGQNIQVGAVADSGAANLDLIVTDLAAIQTGFSSMTIGRSNGTGGITVAAPVSFTDPLVLRSPLGGTIAVNGQITGLDNASVTLDGAGATTNLNANIVTNGNAITISDNVNLLTNVLLNTTNGGATGALIQIDGSVNGNVTGAQNLTFTSGIGNILLNGSIGGVTRLGTFLISSAANVTAQAIAANSITQTIGSGTTTLNGLLATTGGVVNLTNNAILFNGGRINSNAGAGTIVLTANTGSIDSTTSDGIADLTGSTVDLNASAGGIGATNPIEVTSNVLNANTASAGSNVRVKGIGDLSVGLINAGAGNTDLSSTGNINDDSNDAVNDVTAANLTLTANASGKGVGTANGALDTTVSNLTATVGSGGLNLANMGALNLASILSGGNVALTNSSDILVGSINAGLNNVALEASGNINDDADDSLTDITSADLSLTANGVGTDINGSIDTAVSNLTANVGPGGLNIENTGALTITGVTSSGDVDLTNSSDLLVGTINAGANNVNLTSGGNINDEADDADTDITSGNLGLFANGVGTTSSLDTAVSNLTANVGSGGIDLANTGDLTVDSVTSTGNVNLSAASDLIIGSINAGLNNVALEASGNINDDADDSLTDITSADLSLTANGVGTDINGSIDTAVSNLTANVGPGGLNIENTGALTITGVTSSGDVDLTNSSDLLVGTINAGANNVNLTSGGNINDEADDADTDITSGNLGLFANGVGTTSSLDTAVSNLTANVGSGGIDLANTGDLTVDSVTSTGNVNLSAASDLIIGSINAGLNNVALEASGNINDDADDSLTDITSADLSLTANGVGTDINGSIDTAVSNLTANVGPGGLNIENTGALTITGVTSSGDVDLTNSSDLLVGTINAGANNVNLTSGGNINDEADDADTDITSGNLGLFANGVGTTSSLDTAVSNLTANVGPGGLNIENTGALTITGVTSSGDVDLTNSSDLLVGTINAGANNVNLTSGGNINDEADDADTDITSGNLGLFANGVGTTSSLDTAVSNLTANVGSGGIDLANTGDLTVDSVTSTGNVNLSAASDLIIGSINAGLNNVALEASGNINDDADDSLTDITSADLSLTANGVGTDINGSIDTAVSNLTANVGPGGLNIENTGALTITGVTSSGDVDLTNSSDLLVGTINAGANNVNLTSGGNINDEADDADTDITSGNLGLFANGVGTTSSLDTAVSNLTANVGSGGIDLANTGDLTVDSVTSTGNVNLSAASDLIIGSINAGLNNVALEASGNINDDADDSLTDITSADLSLTANGVGTDINGSIDTAVSNLTANVGPGGLNIENTGALTITGVTSSGDVDLTNSSDLLVGTINAGSSNVSLVSSTGAINSVSDNNIADIIGGSISLSADIGIGTSSVLDVTAATALNAQTTGDNISIDGIGALPIGLVTTGNTTAGIVTLHSTGAIDSVNYDGVADIIAKTVNLTADSGGIGFSSPVEIMAGGSTINANTTLDGGNIYLASLGNAVVGLITTGGLGDVWLGSTGSINSAVNDNTADIIGNGVFLEALAGGIGSSSVLDVNVYGALFADTTASNGNIFIDGIGNLPVGEINAGLGNVSLNSTAKIESYATDGFADVIGATLNFTADNGIATALNPLEVTASAALNASTTNDNVFIRSIGNLPLGLIDVGTADITLMSTGNMYDTNAALNNLKGTSLYLTAVTGIGSLTDYIEVLATNVVATTSSGGSFITNGQATSTPPGWSQGKKVGWNGGSQPPGLSKK